MAETTFASPSSSLSATGSLSTPSRGPPQSSDEYYLTVTSEPPPFLYPDETFEVGLSLESFKVSPTSSPPSDIRISVQLQTESDLPDSLFELTIIEEPRISLSRRRVRAKYSIRCAQLKGRDKRSVQLRIDAAGVTGCLTNPMTLVQAKLQVSTAEDWTNVWYKDEGGRDKSMEVAVAAYDRDNNLLHEQIQLEVKLCYHNASTSALAVSNQDILRRLGSEKRLQIDANTGKAKIRWRVEDVSKNHQGQNFVLLISSAQSSEVHVAPVTTPPVNVRSKRNKRQRTGSGGSGRNPTQDLSQSESAPGIGSSGDRGLANDEQLRAALQDVIQWTDEVVNGMHHIQWRVMGYQSHPDGSIDYSRPYHNMRNPNPVVDRLLSLYNQTTNASIRFLQHAVVDAPHPRAESFHGSHAPSIHHPGLMPQAPPPEMHIPTSQRSVHSHEQYAVDEAHAAMGPQMHSVEQYGDAPVVPHYAPPHPAYYSRPVPAKAHPDRLDPLPSHNRDVASPTMDRESDVEYVLARQYKSLRTGHRLGFPAYSLNREILGFYRDSPNNVGIRLFIPISDDDFGPGEKVQATKILDGAIRLSSRAVQSVKECGSIASALDRCLVYEFSKDISEGSK